MGASLTDRLNAVKPKSLVMKGEALHKFLVLPEHRAAVARVVRRMLEISGLQHKDAAFLLGFGDDQTPISRWLAGVEPPNLARILTVPALACALSAAIAESQAGATARYVVTIPMAVQA